MAYDFTVNLTATGVYGTDQPALAGIRTSGENGSAASMVQGTVDNTKVKVTGLTGMTGFAGKTLYITGAATGGYNGTWEILTVASATEVEIDLAYAGDDGNNGSIVWDLTSISILVNLIPGASGEYFELDNGGTPSAPIVYSANGAQGGPALNKSITILGDSAEKTRINSGKQPFLVENLGTESDFYIEDVWFTDTWHMPVHLRKMRNATVINNKVTMTDPVGKNVPQKNNSGQLEGEVWGVKVGCYKANDGPHNLVLIEGNEIDMYTGTYAGSGVENCQSKAIQVMVCPPTSRITVKDNTIRHPAHRGIHVVDARGIVQVHGNVVYMDAPYLHKGDLSEYHDRGIAAGSGLGAVNGFSTVNEPLDNGKVDFWDNHVYIKNKDFLGLQVQGLRRTKVGPITARQNTFSFEGAAAVRPLAPVIYHGIDRGALAGNVFSGYTQVGFLVGANKAVYQWGTTLNQFESSDVSRLAVDSPIMAFFGLDADYNTMVGGGTSIETYQHEPDSEGIADNTGNSVYGYAMVAGDVDATLQAVLTALQANGIGSN